MFIFENSLFPFMLKQHLQQKLLQKLSPQQIQFIKLLQVPTVALDTRIKEELEENPALEDSSLITLEEPKGEYDDLQDDKDDFDSERGEDTGMDEFNVDDYLQDDNTNDYSTNYNNGDDDEEKKETPKAAVEKPAERKKSSFISKRKE